MKKQFYKIKKFDFVVILLLVMAGSTFLIFSNADYLTSITGAQTSTPTGIANVTVSSTTYISLPVATIDFGTLDNNANNNTINDSPAPFQLQNDGTVDVNVTVGATNLFSTSTNPSNAYQFACGTGELACPTGSVTTFTNMPATGSPVLVVADLPFTDSGDQIEIDINVTVPNDEPAGVKGSTVTFVATQA